MNKMINNFAKSAKVMGVVCISRLHKLFTKHPNSTDNPQGYWEHLLFSFINSARLMWYAMLGIIHAVFPFVFAFSTSSAIIRSFKKIVESNRHTPELKKYDMLKWLDVEYDTTTGYKRHDNYMDLTMQDKIGDSNE